MTDSGCGCGGTECVKNYGWRVTFAAMAINLALGILYTWSVISKEMPADWGWNNTDKSWPYAIACLVFALVMVPAGRMQDKYGPRIVATLGGLLVGLGMILASQASNIFAYGQSHGLFQGLAVPIRSITLWGYLIGFGLLAGAGIGFGYASATPPAVKWFSAKKTGLIAGIVVAGFGVSPVYASPMMTKLIKTFGHSQAVLMVGIAFLVIVMLLAQLLKAPASPLRFDSPAKPGTTPAAPKQDVNYTPSEMLKTSQFYLLWFMYFCGAGAGLMIIAKLATIAKEQIGFTNGFFLVAMMAIGNGAGRIIAGMVSDKIGRKATLALFFCLQAVMMLLMTQAKTDTWLAATPMLVIISMMLGANYGANLSLFPAITKDFYGLKNFGMNYGFVFTSWGVGGFVLSLLLVGKIRDVYGNYIYAYYIALALLVLSAFLTMLVKAPAKKTVA